MPEDYGYADVDDVVKQTSSGGRFMKIEDDVVYQVRIVSKPRYVLRHFVNNKFFPHTGDDCDLCGKDVKPSDRVKKDAQWSWVVIDRDDGEVVDKETGVKKGAVKILQAPNSVARRLKEISEIINKRTGKPSWGDPQTFDITIKRYKKSNGFYEYDVNPDPESRGALTEEEQAMVKEADIDLDEVINRAQTSDNLGNYSGGGAKDLETAPESDVDPNDIPDDLGEDTASDDEADDVSDDIPF